MSKELMGVAISSSMAWMASAGQRMAGRAMQPRSMSRRALSRSSTAGGLGMAARRVCNQMLFLFESIRASLCLRAKPWKMKLHANENSCKEAIMGSNQGAKEDERGRKQSRLDRYAEFKRETEKNRGKWLGVGALAFVAMLTFMSGWNSVAKEPVDGAKCGSRSPCGLKK